LLASSAIVITQSAFAYFPGKVEIDGAELKQQPRPDANTVKSLPRGTSFNASDKPTNGYYYIRTATDLGWIDGASIGKPAGNSSTQPQASHAQGQTQNRATPQGRKQVTRKRTRRYKPYQVKAHIDYNFFSISELNAATHSTSFGNAVGFGGQAMWFFNPLTGVGLRIDSISQKVAATDSSTSATYDFSLSTFAVMAGAERIFYEDPTYYFAGSGWLGFASSKLSVTTTASNTSTTNEYSGSPITLLAMLEGGWKINPTFSLYAEAGYRLLNSSNVEATPALSTGSILPNSVSLNFSGPVLGIGVSARF
jgi:hypothetical protein